MLSLDANGTLTAMIEGLPFGSHDTEIQPLSLALKQFMFLEKQVWVTFAGSFVRSLT
jgi:hypothetical protein